jgi:hypothetical protein
MQETLWVENPAQLFSSENWMKFVPLSYMDVPTALNALVRFVTYTCIILAVAKDSRYVLGIPLVLVFTAVIVKIFPNERTLEAFEPLKQIRKYTMPTAANPFMNPLLTDIVDNPDRPEAAPVTSLEVKKQIEAAFKQTSDLYMDTSDRFDLAESMRNFTTIDSAKIPNDLEEFKKFLAKGEDTPDYSSAPPARNGKEKSETYVEALGSMTGLPNTTAQPTGTNPIAVGSKRSKGTTLR